MDDGAEDDKGEALKYEEEQKDFQMKKQLSTKQTAGRSKLQQETITEPTLNQENGAK